MRGWKEVLGAFLAELTKVSEHTFGGVVSICKGAGMVYIRLE